MTTGPEAREPHDRRGRWASASSEQLGRRTLAVVLAVTAVLAVGVMVGAITGRDERAGSPLPPPSPTRTAHPSSPPPDEDAVAGPDTTGVPEGTELEQLDSPGTVAEDGLVLEGLHIVGDLEMIGDGQVLRDSRVDGHVVVRGHDVTIEDSEVGALSVSSATQVVARRVEIFGNLGSDGIHVTSGGGPRASDVLIEGCWVHSPQVESDSHYDGIQVRGVDRLTLRGNTFDLGPWNDRYNAAVFLEDANGGNADVLVERNLINGGGYAMYLGGTDVRLVDNRFGRDANWGLLYPDHGPFEESGSTWADDGSSLSVLDGL